MDGKTKKSGTASAQDRRDFLKKSGKVGATGAAVTLLVSARSLPVSAQNSYKGEPGEPGKPGSPGPV